MYFGHLDSPTDCSRAIGIAFWSNWGFPNRLLSRNCRSTFALLISGESDPRTWQQNCNRKCLGRVISNLWLTIPRCKQKAASTHRRSG